MLDGDSELFHRRGIIVVSGEIIRTNAQPLMSVFSRAVPLEAFHSILHDSIEYLCLSSEFRLLKEGDRVPTYSVEVTEYIAEGEAKFDIRFKEAGYHEDKFQSPNEIDLSKLN